METEKEVEKYLKEQIESLDGICYKFVSPGRTSVPDRVCAMPKGVVFWIECKSQGEKPTPQQYRELSRLRERNQHAFFVDSKMQVDAVIYLIEREIKNARI